MLPVLRKTGQREALGVIMFVVSRHDVHQAQSFLQKNQTCLPDAPKMLLHRSTKGASKARRDHINGEIRHMRHLLPIRAEERERMSYLHSMAAICTFIRKSVFYPELQTEGSGSPLPYEHFLQALPGFIVVMTREGKLIYVSENVVDYLGYSMVDVLQGDTFYDMVDNADMEVVRSHLEAASVLATERAFVCRMHASKPFRVRQDASECSLLVRGRFQDTPKSSRSRRDLQRTFIALCTPTVNRLHDSDAPSVLGHFQSVHRPDMTFQRVSDSVLFHLGYPEEELIGQSWYGLLHPDDLSIGEAGHRTLQQGDEGVSMEMVLRLQHKDLSWVWLYVRAARDSGTGRREVSCNNYVISETEATFLRQKATDTPGALRRSPQDLSLSLGSPCPQNQGNGASRRDTCCLREEWAGPREEPWAESWEEPWAKGGVGCANHSSDTISPTLLLRDGPTFPTTPPLSPDSAHSPVLTEGRGSDFCYGYAEDFLAPQRSLYPYVSPSPPLQVVSETAFCPSGLGVASSPESCYGFPACSTDARLVPDFLPGPAPCGTMSDVAFHPEGFGLPAPLQEGAGPFLPTDSSALLTPDPSPTKESHFLYSQEEQAEISILAQQISSLANSFHMYHSQSPAHSLSPTLNPSLKPVLSPALNSTLSPALSLALNPALSPVLSPTHSPALSLALNPVLSPTLSLTAVYSKPSAPASPSQEPLLEPELLEPELILHPEALGAGPWKRSPTLLHTHLHLSPGTDLQTHLHLSPGTELQTHLHLSPGTDLQTHLHLSPGTDLETQLHLSAGTDLQTQLHLSPGTDLETQLHLSPGTDLETQLHLSAGTDLQTQLHLSPGTDLETQLHLSPGTDLQTHLHLSPGTHLQTHLHLSPGTDLETQLHLSAGTDLQTQLHLSPGTDLETQLHLSAGTDLQTHLHLQAGGPGSAGPRGLHHLPVGRAPQPPHNGSLHPDLWASWQQQ
ncbi:hypothetical protein SKAU_G00179570 [Synaphobranchus kaupii]|uniref:PAS domain-containing protein n=1 Tax=Synaphobranchus kaupii TaxID=118154 RepID=A0A9Q1FLW7_SYNKA|nr:hypothetical protein SKAU_G00179570 [Synaphobranchus kaupii]